MYQVDKDANRLKPLDKPSFRDLGFREREHLQEWIANEPSILGEWTSPSPPDLLIILKEFDGFSETQERLDLLALDRHGAVVVIENKLDDSGRDVTCQALKYASYCSSLTKEHIRDIYQLYQDKVQPGSDAESRLCEFFGKTEFEELSLNPSFTQRVMLVAGRFRKEVTSTVLWLLNYQIRLQCFRVTPYTQDDDVFLSIEQVIPPPDTESYMIGMAEKAKETIQEQAQARTRHAQRRAFWTKLLQTMNAASPLFSNVSPGERGWIATGSGLSGVSYNFAATRSYGRVEVYVNRGDREENKRIFELLMRHKDDIERKLGEAPVWEHLSERNTSRIKLERPGNIFDIDELDEMIAFMDDAMQRLETAFRGPIQAVGEASRGSRESAGVGRAMVSDSKALPAP